MQTIQIQNTTETRRAFAIALAAIDTVSAELNGSQMGQQFNSARLELLLIHAAMLVADSRERAAGSDARAS